ncbi:Hypp3817 [Branchiostoma lanceolatum]|uniref:Hypp3817 protein n=1 Tax=Branchiostoma lanceolatum TaxID=7740 RepID=A0A8K0EVI9_BRALA|nr:Hypp3817 [Branchiostoma lanceolatum]
MLNTCLLAVLVAALIGVGEGSISLEPLSTVYLPWEFNNDGTLDYDLDKGAAEQVAYHPGQKMVYAVGVKGLLTVVDLTVPTAARVIHTQELPNAQMGKYNDLALCGDNVAVIQSDPLDPLPGTLYIYGIYNGFSDLTLNQQLQVGSAPSSVKFTSDCTRLVVVNEGKDGYDQNGNFKNPAGTISVVDFDIENVATGGSLAVHTVNFLRFDHLQDEYGARGVRWVYRGEGTGTQGRMSEELEPEDFTFDENGGKIYVTLQENNAIAVVDLITLTVEDIYPLGAKNWADYMLDPSDKDGGIRMQNWPIFGLYQPDDVVFFTAGSHKFLATANEGNSRELTIGGVDISDEWRGTDFVTNNAIAQTVPLTFMAALLDEAQLGVLRFSNYDGKSASNPDQYEQFYTFGGRGFSLWNADNLTQFWDSGADVELKHSQHLPLIFNCEFDNDNPSKSPMDEMDEASKKKGPETESLTVAEVYGKTVIIIGNERPSSIMIYSVDAVTGIPSFESIYRAGDISKDYDDAYRDRDIGDVDPENLQFVPANESPDGTPLLLVVGNISGTVSVYRVVDSNEV